MTRQRKKYAAEFKAKATLEALAGNLTLADLFSTYGIYSAKITKWKKQAMEGVVDYSPGKEKLSRMTGSLNSRIPAPGLAS